MVTLISLACTLFLKCPPLPLQEEGVIAYSFAKTPLKAAQAPLAAASGIQGIAVDFAGAEGAWGIASGIRGSASVSMVAGVDGDGGGFYSAPWFWRGLDGQGRVSCALGRMRVSLASRFVVRYSTVHKR